MKNQGILTCGICLCILLFMNLEAYAQNPINEFDSSVKENCFLSHFSQQLTPDLWEMHNPLANQNLALKPTEEMMRLKAYQTEEYDGIFFIPVDSTRIYWGDTDGDADEVVDLFLYLLGQPVFGFYDVNNTILIPFDSTYMYGWDEDEEILESKSRNKSVFDGSGNIIEQIEQEYDEPDWINDDRHLFAYTSQNRIKEAIGQSWNGSVWENDSKDTYIYDSKGRLTEYSNSDWDKTASSWLNDKKEIYSYNAADELTRKIEQDWNQSRWVNETRESFTYESGNRTSMIEEEWNEAVQDWENDEKIEYAYANNQRVAMVNLTWNGTTWEKDSRKIYEYDAEGNNTEIKTQYWYSNAWKTYFKDLFTYSGGNLMTTTYLTWADSTSEFEEDQHFKYQYNSNGYCTRAISFSAWSGSQWGHLEGDNDVKFYYELYDTGTSTDDILAAEEFRVYPNPASDILHIAIEKAAIQHIRIVDMNGRTVYETQSDFNAAEVVIPTVQITDGTYLLQVTSDGKQGVKKIVIMH